MNQIPSQCAAGDSQDALRMSAKAMGLVAVVGLQASAFSAHGGITSGLGGRPSEFFLWAPQ